MNKLIIVSATIVTYNNTESVLLKTINSFLNTSLDVTLYIVDNSPNDSIRNLCSDERIDYKYVGNNIGFGAGHNIILKQKEKLGVYHLILNPDIFIPEKALAKLIEYYNINPEIGMLSPRILYPDNTVQYLPKSLPIPLNLVLRFFPILEKVFPKLAKNYTMENANYDKPLKLAMLSGCFMIVKSDKIEDIAFDERFFMYFEDFDFSRRIGERYDLVMNPSIHIYHDYERGAHKSYFLFKTLIMSMIKYFNKWGWIFDKTRSIKNKEMMKQFD